VEAIIWPLESPLLDLHKQIELVVIGVPNLTIQMKQKCRLQNGTVSNEHKTSDWPYLCFPPCHEVVQTLVVRTPPGVEWLTWNVIVVDLVIDVISQVHRSPEYWRRVDSFLGQLLDFPTEPLVDSIRGTFEDVWRVARVCHIDPYVESTLNLSAIIEPQLGLLCNPLLLPLRTSNVAPVIREKEKFSHDNTRLTG